MAKAVRAGRVAVAACCLVLPISGSNAALLDVESIQITGGFARAWTADGTPFSNPDSTAVDQTITPFTSFAPNTDIVGGTLNAIVGFDWFGSPVTTLTNVSGATVPTIQVDTSSRVMTADLSAWHFTWSNWPVTFSGTGVDDGWTSPVASGVWDPVTGDFELSWNSTYGQCTPTESCRGQWNLTGTATLSAVPLPPAALLFGSGLLSLGIGAARNHRRRSAVTAR